MSYKVITEYKNIDINKWSKFVENHPNGNVFQTPDMYEVYKNSKHWNPVVLVVEDGEKNIVGSLLAVIQKEHGGIVGKFSARSIIWGGPLINSNNFAILDILLNVGICGASKNYKIGQLIDGFEENLTCVDKEVDTKNEYELVDMESAGFIEATKNMKNIYMYKIVSDNFEPETVTKENTKKLIFDKLDEIMTRIGDKHV